MTRTVWALALGVVALALLAPQMRSPRVVAAPAGGQVRPGSLEGRVRLSGDGSQRETRVENTTDPEACGTIQSLEDLLLSSRGRGVRNVIVALVDVAEEKLPPLTPKPLILHNVNCRFSPHAAVLTVGSPIEARSSDPVLHTVHFYGALEANVSLPSKGSRVTKVAERQGMIAVKCDVHGWMQAFIRVDRHPFHAVSGADGAFGIQVIPPGSYVLEAWHERLGAQRVPVRIEQGKTERVEIWYSPGGR